jgi:TonB family protein
MRCLIAFFCFLTVLSAADLVREPLSVSSASTGPWRITKASVELPPEALPPRLVAAPQMTRSRTPSEVQVSVSFQIDAQGSPADIRIEKTSNDQLNDEVVAMIREWRFEAAKNSSASVPSRAFFDLAAGGPEEQLPAGPRPRRVRQ